MNGPGHEVLSTQEAQNRFDQLLLEARNGSSEALGELLEQCRPYLLLIANQDLDPAVKVKVAASDLVQETLLTAQQKMSDFAGRDSGEWLRWLRTILANDVMHAGRRYKQTAKRQLDREVPFVSSPDTPVGNMRIGPNRTPDIDVGQMTPGTQSVANEEAEALARALARLPEESREVLHLHNWERLSFEEIGRRIDRSAEAARKIWSRAVVRLKKELQSRESDEPGTS